MHVFKYLSSGNAPPHILSHVLLADGEWAELEVCAPSNPDVVGKTIVLRFVSSGISAKKRPAREHAEGAATKRGKLSKLCGCSGIIGTMIF
jgi:hypothetical protein